MPILAAANENTPLLSSLNTLSTLPQQTQEQPQTRISPHQPALNWTRGPINLPARRSALAVSSLVFSPLSSAYFLPPSLVPSCVVLCPLPCPATGIRPMRTPFGHRRYVLLHNAPMGSREPVWDGSLAAFIIPGLVCWFNW